jgi:AcrR family transcriptional regulator
MRADARRNRERLLAVAEQVFAQKGVTASTEEIAREAGVGIGTVFRHFPTKEALLAAVFVGRLQWLADEAESLCMAEDPGAAFVEFFTLVVSQSATKNAFADALTQAGVDVYQATVEARQGLLRGLGELLVRAQQAGALRADVGVEDVLALLVGASRTAEHVTDPTIRARTLRIVLDGLRAPAQDSTHR